MSNNSNNKKLLANNLHDFIFEAIYDLEKANDIIDEQVNGPWVYGETEDETPVRGPLPNLNREVLQKSLNDLDKGIDRIWMICKLLNGTMGGDLNLYYPSIAGYDWFNPSEETVRIARNLDVDINWLSKLRAEKKSTVLTKLLLRGLTAYAHDCGFVSFPALAEALRTHIDLPDIEDGEMPTETKT